MASLIKRACNTTSDIFWLKRRFQASLRDAGDSFMLSVGSKPTAKVRPSLRDEERIVNQPGANESTGRCGKLSSPYRDGKEL